MSHVYMARDLMIGRTVAIKILTESGAADETTKARFIREAQLAGNVIHDNIIRVYDFGEDSGRLFMVMEFLEGEDLNDTIKNGHAGSLENRIGIAVQVARAMEHVHSLQITHRDLKPHNVYLTREGVAKLMDFGIAKTDQTSMTKTGFTVGTPNYMPPEQVLGKQVNHLSDVYAYGILLFELLTGTRPYNADTLDRLFYQVLHEPVDLAPLRNGGVPEPLVSLIASCTEKDPSSRPQSFRAVREQLESIQRGASAPPVEVRRESGSPAAAPARAMAEPAVAPPVAAPRPEPPPQPSPEPPSRKWLIPAIAAAVVVMAAGGYFAFRPSTKPTETAKTDAAVVKAPPATLSLPSGDMVLVAAGGFPFGEKKEPRDTPAYYIDQTEVTNAAFKSFLDATGFASPKGFTAAKPDFPVVNVTMKDAREFARWAGKRIPTAVEWEKAARGADGRLYPWGDSPQSSMAAVAGGAPLRPAFNDSGKSPYGAMQMAGNVWELVDQAGTPSPQALEYYGNIISPKPTAGEPWCTIRGGSYLDRLVPVYEFATIPERFHKEDIGFRCVRDVR